MKNGWLPSCLLGPLLLVLLIVSFLDINPAFGAGNSVPNDPQKAFNEKNYELVTQLLGSHLADLKKPELLILGKSYSELGNTMMAQKVFMAGIAKFPTDSEVKSLQGRELFRAGKPDEAILVLKGVIEKDKSYLPAYQLMVPIFEKKGNKYELRLLYQDMVERFGQKYEFISRLCELTTKDALYDLALKYCQLGSVQNPKEPENFVYLGIAMKDPTKPEEAEALLKRTAENFPKSELAQITYAKILAEKKNYIDAFRYYTKAIVANPESFDALMGAGVCGFEIQKLEASLNAFARACKISRAASLEFRKATNTLRIAKNQVWQQKFEQAMEKCDYRPSPSEKSK